MQTTRTKRLAPKRALLIFPPAAWSPLMSHSFRQHKRLAIRPPQQPIRLRIIPAGLRLSIEVQRLAQANGDVAEVTQPRALVPVFDVGGGAAAGADAI